MSRLSKTSVRSSAALLLLFALAKLPGELNKERGKGPTGVDELNFTIHRVGTEHAEGITSIDMNGDGRPDLVSGAYWYENPGAAEANGSAISFEPWR